MTKQKRVIKFHNPYKNDGIKFSNCSTKYEIFPVLFGEDSGKKELKSFCESIGLKTVGKIKESEPREYWRGLEITHAYKTEETVKGPHRDGECHAVYIGLITLPECGDGKTELTPQVNLKVKMTEESALEIVNSQDHGVYHRTDIDGEGYLVIEDWNYFHEINLLGYDLEQFEELMCVTNTTFSDEVFSCGECGTWDFNDNGYQYNFRIVNDCEQLGTKCGCYESHVLSDISEYINNSDKCIDSEIVEQLVEDGTLEKINQYVGGMTDSHRHHSIGGESAQIGTPEKILADLLRDNEGAEYVFCLDECGQFQTYFSVYKVLK